MNSRSTQGVVAASQRLFFSVPIVLLLLFPRMTRAGDNTLLFDLSSAGVTKAITNWGMSAGVNGTLEGSPNLAGQFDLIYMGTNTVNFAQVAFSASEPLTNDDLTGLQKWDLTKSKDMANMATAAANRWILTFDNGASVASWYQSGEGTVYPDRWAALMSAWQRNYNKTFWIAQPFNEPDSGGQGSQQNLYDILEYLQTSTNFTGTEFGGGSTFDCDQANAWYNAIASRAKIGTTHAIDGSVSNYVSFIQNVLSQGGIPMNTAARSVCEAIIGAEHGLQGVRWWQGAQRTRGEFANANQGKRLGYSANWSNWTAAAVYRETNGAVKAFLGAGNQHAIPTTYRLFSKDRDVFYDGDGPRRDCTVAVYDGNEHVINITNGADVQPKIRGRYVIVNRNSGKVLEVPGTNTAWGTPLVQVGYVPGASNQLWYVFSPVGESARRERSIYLLSAAHSASTAILSNVGASDGNGVALIQYQYGPVGSLKERWFFEYVGDGYFKIRSLWSRKVVGVSGGSSDDGAAVVQWDDNGSLDQQWRFIPEGASPVDLTAPATPAGLTATPNSHSVRLSWNENSESDLAGYTVLRSLDPSGPFDTVARLLTTNSFTDKSANQAMTYYYVVKAADRSLNTSGNSIPASAAPTLGKTLIARYPFDGDLGDISGNANHPIVTNLTPTFADGRFSPGLALNGATQYLMLPANMLATVTNFTVSAWVNWNGGGDGQRVFDFGNDASESMFLTPRTGNGTMMFAINGQTMEAGALPTNQWAHIAVTRSNTTVRVYTNGVLAASGANTIAPASFNPALNYIGKSQAADPLFNGRIDDFRVYNYSLSAAAIEELFDVFAPVLISAGATWRYFDKTNDLGTAWRNTTYNDAAWGNGPARFGYGNDGEVTQIASNRQWTTYFRREFYVADPASLVGLSGRLTRDDAAVIYINGTEVWRDFNFPVVWTGNAFIQGAITNQTPARTALGGPYETNWVDMTFSSASVVAGWNVIAAEVHNQSLTSSDLGFDFELRGALENAAAPALKAFSSSGVITLTAPAEGAYFSVYTATNLAPPVSWEPLTNSAVLDGAEWRLTLPPETNGQRYFRLQGH